VFPIFVPHYASPSKYLLFPIHVFPLQAATAQHHSELSRAVAYATGRYLHVMFPENVHQASLVRQCEGDVQLGLARTMYVWCDGVVYAGTFG